VVVQCTGEADADRAVEDPGRRPRRLAPQFELLEDAVGVRQQRLPAGVSATLRVLRSNSVTPSSRSSFRIVWLSGDCASRSRAAARPKCSSEATATNASSDLISMPTPSGLARRGPRMLS
jgi:hypothetical protein